MARRFGNALLKKGSESVSLKTFQYYDRMLPMQDSLPDGSLGNLIALPLQGQALKEGNSAFIDENWNAYADQWSALFEKPKYTREFVESKIKEWGLQTSYDKKNSADIFAETEEKPWEKENRFVKGDVDGVMQITFADGVYVVNKNLADRIQNRIRKLAAFPNPMFFKNQAMGLSNFTNRRYVYLGSDDNRYIKVPRKLLENLILKCDQAGINYQIEDQRNAGKKIKAWFSGELKTKQKEAVNALLQNDCGILSAATVFGKTVVCCDLIAQRKTNTLILLQSSTLMPQWREALENFLIIDEEPPEYQTLTGRIKNEPV